MKNVLLLLSALGILGSSVVYAEEDKKAEEVLLKEFKFEPAYDAYEKDVTLNTCANGQGKFDRFYIEVDKRDAYIEEVEIDFSDDIGGSQTTEFYKYIDEDEKTVKYPLEKGERCIGQITIFAKSDEHRSTRVRFFGVRAEEVEESEEDKEEDKEDDCQTKILGQCVG